MDVYRTHDCNTSLINSFLINGDSIYVPLNKTLVICHVRDFIQGVRFFLKGPRKNQHEEIERLTKELVDTVEQRNGLVEMLEEDRLR